LICATFPAHVSPGHAFTVGLALQNHSTRERLLGRIGIGHSEWVGDSLQLVPYVVREYPDLRLAPGAWYRDSTVVALDAAQIASAPMLYVHTWDRVQSYDEWVWLGGLAGR
jgi:hypothetical protein